MAVLTGIQGMQIGDGAGGKVALSIQERVLRILADDHFTYRLATMQNPNEVKAGTVSYYVPELIGAENYGSGDTEFQNANVGLVSINLDTRRDVKWEVETFDISRLNEADYIIGMISTGIAMAVLADLNGAFWRFLAEKFNSASGEATVKTQKIQLDYLCKKNDTIDPDKAFADYINIEYKMNDINQTFDKAKLGVPKAEIMAIVAPVVDTNLKIAFRNQPNAIGNWQIDGTLAGKQVGNLKYVVDSMLNKNIPAGSSFSKDTAVDLTKVMGLLFHNEAIAMPININQIIAVTNPNNGNPRWITKYQYGIGFVRPSLVFMIEDKANPVKNK